MKKKQFLLPLLMAIVMMAMSPTRMWAEDLTVEKGETKTISSTANYENVEVKGTLIIASGGNLSAQDIYVREGASFTIESGATLSGLLRINGGMTINYGTIYGVIYLSADRRFANHGTINASIVGEFSFYNTGDLDYYEGSIAKCSHSATEGNGTHVDATCTSPGGTQSGKCSVCGYIGFIADPTNYPALDHDFPTDYTNGIKECSRCHEKEYEPATLVTGDNASSFGLDATTYRDYYAITNAGQLYWLRDYVNKSTSNRSAKAVLTADIVINDGTFAADGTFTLVGETNASTPLDWSPINNFNGAFDGNGHTISGLFVKNNNWEYALFGTCGSSSQIKNLGITDCYIECALGDNASLCFTNNGLITNCYTTGTVKAGTNRVSGLCFSNCGTISNCYSICKVTTGGDGAAGLCYSNSGTVTNCYTTYDTAILDNKTASGAKVYWVETKTADAFSEGEVAYRLNGSVSSTGTWSAGTGTPVWYQRLGDGGDSYPVLKKASDGSNTVYYGYDGCVTRIYTNDVNKTAPVHDYTNNNGFCTVCGAYESATQVTAENYSSLGFTADSYAAFVGYYAIGNAGQLFWFAANASGKNAVLTKDIENVSVDVNDRPWTPFDLSYGNVFDGNGHTISSMYYKTSHIQHAGLVNTNKGTIRNLGVKNSMFETISFAGGVCGENNNGTITNCYATNVEIHGSSTGGLCGRNGNNGTISNCYATDVPVDGSPAGGVCGENDNSTITNCYATNENSSISAGGVCGKNNGTITNCYTNMETPIGSGNPSKAVYTEGLDVFSSGKVCYLLNGSVDDQGTWTAGTGTPVWYQNLSATGGDSAPVLTKASDGSNTVYYGYDGCTLTYANKELAATPTHEYDIAWSWAEDGKTAKATHTCQRNSNHVVETVATVTSQQTLAPTCGAKGETTYTAKVNVTGTEQTDTKTLADIPALGHDFPTDYTNGIKECSRCHEKEYESATQVTAENYSSLGFTADNYAAFVDYYAIGNAGQLFWFAANANYKSAVLTANIENVSDYDKSEDTYHRPWTPFDLNYSYVFDGNNHTIGGLSYNGSKEIAGLVAENKGTIRNLGVKDSQFIAYQKAGGICGHNRGTISNCYATEVSSSSLKNGGCYAGGICGWNSNGTISNCYATDVYAVTQNGFAGGVSGKNDVNGTITNCYVTEVYPDGSNAGGVCGSNYATITNCYATEVTLNGVQAGGGVCGYFNNGTISNCYTDMWKTIGSGNTSLTVYTKEYDAFSSGEVCYLLNGSRSEGTAESPLVWYQNLSATDGDSHPVLKKASDGSNTVYYGYKNCTEQGYANTALSATPGDHDYGVNDKCTVCQAELKKFYGEVTKDGNPAEGIEVVAKSKTNDVEYYATTGSDGKYTMNIYQDGLEYTVSLKNIRGYEGTTPMDGNFNSSCDFTLTRHKVSVHIGEYQYTTFYDGVYDMIIPEGFTAWTAEVWGEEIIYSELSQYIPAGTGVLLYHKEAIQTDFLSATVEVENNVTDNVFFGYDADTTPTSSVFKYYKLQYSEEQNRVGFYYGAENGAPFLCKAHKAYVGISKSSPAKMFTNLPMGDDVTAIDLTPIYSDREGAVYNLSGQKVSANYKGIVIKNGKKVMQ